MKKTTEIKDINGIAYIIDTYEDGAVCKRLKNTGAAKLPSAVKKAKEILATAKPDELDKTDQGKFIKAIATALKLI